MNLASSLMGLRLAHPFVAGASPLGRDIDTIRRLEDAGAAAIVLPSLFEEQITLAAEGRIRHADPLDERQAPAIEGLSGVRRIHVHAGRIRGARRARAARRAAFP